MLRIPLLVSAIIAMLAAAGCNSQKPVIIPRESSGSTAARCEETLASVLEMIEPERLEISSDRSSAAALLNSWREQCAKQQVAAAAIQPQTRQLLAGVFSESQLAELSRTQGARFTDRDIDHLRNCRMIRRMALQITRNAKSPLDRILAIFYFIDRNVELVPSLQGNLSLSHYDVLLLGRGTAAHRAWAFAELLRQLHLTAVILHAPATDGSEKLSERPASIEGKSKWLVGVLTDGDVALFDFSLGMPIPGADDPVTTVRVRKPATLAEAQANPELLRQLDLTPSSAYPWQVEDFERLRVDVITSAGFLASRMVSLELEMAGDRSALIYDPLDDVDGAPGLISRVAAFQKGSAFERANIGVWPFPEQQLEAAERRSEEQIELFSLFRKPFEGPLTFETDRVAAANYERARDADQLPKEDRGALPETAVLRRELLKSRIEQLLGDHLGANMNYQQVRLWESGLAERMLDLEKSGAIQRGSPEWLTLESYLSLNALSAREANYWLGTLQMDQGHFASASETLAGYVTRYGQQTSAPWAYQSRALLSEAFAEQKKYAIALTILDSFPPDRPQSYGVALQARRIRKLAAQSQEANTPSPDSPVKSPPAAPAKPDPVSPEGQPPLTGILDDAPVEAPQPESN